MLLRVRCPQADLSRPRNSKLRNSKEKSRVIHHGNFAIGRFAWRPRKSPQSRFCLDVSAS